MESLNKKNFNKINDGSFKSYNEFCKYLEDNNLFLDFFYIDMDNIINKVWYIEDFITYPLFNISKRFFDMLNLPEVIRLRREYLLELKNKRKYVSMFSLLEKCFRISYFLDLYKEINSEEFIDLFSYVYSSCEYNFDELLEEEVMEKLRKAKNTVKIKKILNKEFQIKDEIITIYRGEADNSTPYNEGAISWTLDSNIAKFFANRFNAENPRIYKAKVNINDILLFIDREKELLVESKNLIEVKLLN